VQFNLVQSHQHFITNNAITQLAVYEYVKSMILADTAATGHMELNTGEKLFAGALAGIASVATTYPLDIARTRLSLLQLSIDSRAVAVDAATAATAPRSMIGVMRYIYKEEGGLIGLYRGMSPTTLGVAPYVALNFTFYESMKGLVDKDGRPPSVAYKLFCGGFAGAMAQTLTYPLDLIRRRFQVMNLKAEAGGFTYHYSSTGDAFRQVHCLNDDELINIISQIIRHEGLRGLYKGCLPNYLKVVPAIAVSFVSYETVKQLLTPKLIS
jgi:solute carrier family 25 phosphate transporter 23/24/25/41